MSTERIESSRESRDADPGIVRLMYDLPGLDYQEMARAADEIIRRYDGKPEGTQINPFSSVPSPYTPLAARALLRAGILIEPRSESGHYGVYSLDRDALESHLSSAADDSGLLRLIRETRSVPSDETIARSAAQVIENYSKNANPSEVPESALVQGVLHAGEAIGCLVDAGVLVRDQLSNSPDADERFYVLNRRALDAYLPVPSDSSVSSSQ